MKLILFSLIAVLTICVTTSFVAARAEGESIDARVSALETKVIELEKGKLATCTLSPKYHSEKYDGKCPQGTFVSEISFPNPGNTFTVKVRCYYYQLACARTTP